jgi:hypothetical protein
MKRVFWKDDSGNSHCSLLRDTDDETRPEIGIPLEPPPIERIVCEAAMELQNLLVAQGLITYQDVVASQNGVSSALFTVLRRKILEAYKLKELEQNGK